MPAMRDHGALGIARRARGIDNERRRRRVELSRHVRKGRNRRVGIALLDDVIEDAQLVMAVGKHRRRIDDNDHPQIRQAVDDRQDLIDVFLILSDEDRRATVAHLILNFRDRRRRIDAVTDGAGGLRAQVRNTHSSQASPMIATRSPGCRPLHRSPAATRPTIAA